MAAVFDNLHHSDQDIRNRLLIARLPAMPQILVKLIEHLQADDLGMQELATLISRDAGMTGKLMAVANSSAYHRGQRSANLEQSLVALGTDMIKTLVISDSVFQTFNSFPHSGSADLRRFWKGSLTAAVLARDAARLLDYAHPEEAYLAGLLHNVGRLALLAAAPKEYAVNFFAPDDDDLCAIEQRTLEITHTEAGAWLIERWQLDSFLADAVLYHHEPSERLEASHPLIRIVRLAHVLSSHADDAALVEGACALCGIDVDRGAKLLTSAARQVEQSAIHLGIDLAGADDVPAPQAGAPAPIVDPVQARLNEEVRTMVLVSEVGQSLARQQGEAGLLDAMTRTARVLFDFDSAVVLLENPLGDALVGAPSAGAQRIAEFTIPLAKGGPVARSALERRPAFVQRASQPPGLAEEQLLRILGTDSLATVPLVLGARCLGVIIGGIHAWQLPQCRRRERFLQAFGSQAAGALENMLRESGQARRQLASVADDFRDASRRVVHEVNNPLAIIKNYLSVLDGKLARQEPVGGELSILNEEIDRVGQLVGSLAEPRAVDAGPRPTDAARVVDEVLRLFRTSGFVPATVTVVARMGQDSGMDAAIEGDPDVLKQILVNLVKNAAEALKAQGRSGGRIEIVNRGNINRERALYLELVVSDNGPGLSREVLANLFSPVQSSKDGANHGLGLSIVHSLVTRLGGHIACRSSASGTSFEILLPAWSGAGAALALPARALGSV